MDNPHLLQALKSAGYRFTPQRMAVCTVLEESTEHPTAHGIYEAIKPAYPSLSLATVYNTLDALVSLGVVHTLTGSGDDPTQYDANLAPHAHLRCVRCGKLTDIHSPHIQTLNNHVANQTNYKIVGTYLLYQGICENCNQGKK